MKRFIKYLIPLYCFSFNENLVAQCNHPEDYTGLRDLYLSTDGDNWTNRSGWPSRAQFLANPTPPPGTDMSGWFGIFCIDLRVTRVNLSGNNLTGTIPNLNFSKLKYLDLISNNLSGKIPDLYLPNLTTLHLSNNQFSGEVPNFNLENLETLLLSNNYLNGNLPSFNLPNLKFLSISSNQLKGDIPKLVFPRIEYLSLHSNLLYGEIPQELFYYSDSTIINLDNNNLSGCYLSLGNKYCNNINFSTFNNKKLPWKGNFTKFCSTDGSQQAQVGAPCDNGNPLDGANDVIQSDCRCGTFDCVITDTVQVCPGSIISVLQRPFTYQVAFDPPWAGYFDSLCQCVMVSDTFSGYAHVYTDQPGPWRCFEIFLDNTLQFIVSLETVNTSCGINNGSIIVNSSVEIQEVLYTWTGGLSGQIPMNVAPGTYTVTVTQTSTGCTGTATTTVNASTPLTATATVTQPSCGLNNGSIVVGPGPAGYTYAWTGGLSGQNPTNIGPGTYTVTITQTSTGCTGTATATVNASTPLTATATVTQPSCGLNNGSIVVSPGPTGYTYVWTNGLSGQNPTNVGPGTYTVTVTQTSTGCTARTAVTLDASTTLTATATTTQSSCGKNNGSIRINPSGAGYTYSWTGGLTGPNPNNAGPGTYSVTVTQNTGGCTATVTAVVTEENNTIEAEPDSLFVKEGQTTQLNILANDTYPTEAYTLKLGDLPQEYIELLSFEQSGVLGIEPVNIFSEPVTSTYKLCNKCEDCVEGTLYFIDDRLKEIILVTMITPKEAANNRLQFSKDPIPGMEVWVYNRWGQQVYHSKDYQNDWDASGYAGGVYYYVLKVYGLTIKKTLTVVK